MKNAFVIGIAGLLAACGSQQAGYQITDRHHSITVTRDQQYPGAKWDTKVIVSRFPECVRRHAIVASGDKFKMDLYRFEAGVFVLNHGKNWYAAETKECRLQKFDTPPPEPGDLIGAWQIKDAELVYLGKDEKPSADEDGKPKSKKKSTDQ